MVGLCELQSLHHVCKQHSPSWRLAGTQITHVERAAKGHKVHNQFITDQQNYKDTKLKHKKLFGLLDTKCQGNKKSEMELLVDKQKCHLIGNTKIRKE